MKDTLFQICVSLTILMFLFTLSVQYVSGLGIFSDEPIIQGVDTKTGSESYSQATQSPDYENGYPANLMWATIFAGAGGLGLVLSYFTQSPSILGVFVFSASFWASYVNTLNVIRIGSFIDPNFMFIGTAAMFFIWAGAVAGMLSGSG